MIFLLHVALSISSPALSPVLVMSSRVAGMTDDLSTPCPPVCLLARSQSSTFQVSCLFIFCSIVLSSFSLIYRSSELGMCSSSLLITCPHQFNLRDLLGSLRHSRYSSNVFVPDLVFACRTSTVASSSRSPQSSSPQ